MIFNKKNESLLNLSRVIDNETIAPVTALDPTTTTAIADNEAAEENLEKVKEELDAAAEDIAGKEAKEEEAPIKNVFTAKLTLKEDLEDFGNEKKKDGRANKFYDDDGMNRWLDYDMFQFILDLFVTIPEFATDFPDSMFPEIETTTKSGKKTRKRVRSTFMYQGSDNYLTGEGVTGVSQVGVDGDNLILYADSLDVFKSVKILCDYFDLRYDEPVARKSSSSRWAFNMKIYTPMMSHGYPEMFIDYIEDHGLDYHDFMTADFITGYEKAKEKEDKENLELLFQSKIKEIVTSFATKMTLKSTAQDRKDLQQEMLNELATAKIEDLDGNMIPLEYSESKAKTLFNKIARDYLHN